MPGGSVNTATNSATITGVTSFGDWTLAEPAPVAPTLASAVSELTHGGSGTFDINLPLSGTAGVEDRSSSQYHIILTFSNGPITSGTAIVTAGTATAGAPTFSGNTMTVPLIGVTNAQVITLRVSNVNGQGGSASVNLGFLVGDTTGDGLVNSADISQTKAQSGATAGAGNFPRRCDDRLVDQQC
jgi:D-serine deaminase-like pyridoxal phosphate-dependent protein